MGGQTVGQIVIVAAGALTIGLAGFQLVMRRRAFTSQRTGRQQILFAIAIAVRVSMGALLIIVGLGAPRIFALAALVILLIGSCWSGLARRAAGKQPSG